MDEDQLTTSLRDEIGLAIEDATAVAPAPGLAAQVRARVDRERMRPARWPTWQLATVAAAVAVVIAALLVSFENRLERGDVANALIAASHLNATAPYLAAAQPASLWSDEAPAEPTRTSRPTRVLLSPDAIALRNYIAYLRQANIVTAPPGAVEATTQALDLPAISIERIAINPLPKLEAVTGERQ